MKASVQLIELELKIDCLVASCSRDDKHYKFIEDSSKGVCLQTKQRNHKHVVVLTTPARTVVCSCFFSQLEITFFTTPPLKANTVSWRENIDQRWNSKDGSIFPSACLSNGWPSFDFQDSFSCVGLQLCGQRFGIPAALLEN